jgi:hypothetical protein
MKEVHCCSTENLAGDNAAVGRLLLVDMTSEETEIWSIAAVVVTSFLIVGEK